MNHDRGWQMELPEVDEGVVGELRGSCLPPFHDCCVACDDAKTGWLALQLLPASIILRHSFVASLLNDIVEIELSIHYKTRFQRGKSPIVS